MYSQSYSEARKLCLFKMKLSARLSRPSYNLIRCHKHLKQCLSYHTPYIAPLNKVLPADLPKSDSSFFVRLVNPTSVRYT